MQLKSKLRSARNCQVIERQVFFACNGLIRREIALVRTSLGLREAFSIYGTIETDQWSLVDMSRGEVEYRETIARYTGETSGWNNGWSL